MTKHIKFTKDQEDFILENYSKIKKNKAHKINTQLVIDFNTKYPNVTVTYSQLYYIITKKAKVRNFFYFYKFLEILIFD